MNIKLFLITTSSLLIYSINSFLPLSAQTNNITQTSPASVATSIQNPASTPNDRGLKPNDKENEGNTSIETPIPNTNITKPKITVDKGINGADVEQKAVVEAKTPLPNPDTTKPQITVDKGINETDVEEATVIEEEIDEADFKESFDESEDGIFFFDEDLKEDNIQNAPPIQGFILQHRIDKGIERLKDETEGELWILLQTLKDVIVAARLEQSVSKPLQIDTVIEILLSEYMTQLIEADLPDLSAQTKINRVGKGRTIFKLPDFYYRNGEDVLTWSGFKSQLRFTDKFDSFKAILKIADFLFDDEYELLSISKMKLTGIFDADLILKQVELNLPFLKIEDENGELEIQNLVFNLNMKQSHKGIEIGYFTLTIGELNFDDGISTVQLHQIVLTGSGETQNDALNYTLQSQVGQLNIACLLAETLKMSFQGTLELRRIDLDAMIEWQTSVRELKKQRQQGNISADIMIIGQLFKFNEILPKLLVKLPQLTIPQLYINSKAGKVQGKLLFSIDSKKATILKNQTNWLPVLNAQVELNIGKQWLAKILTHYAYHTLRQEAEAQVETQSVETHTKANQTTDEPVKKQRVDTLTEADEPVEKTVETPSVETHTLTEADEPIEPEPLKEQTEEELAKGSMEKPVEEQNADESILTEKQLADLQIQAKAKGEQQLKQYVKQKWLVNADADNYNLLLSLSDNQLTINGEKQPLLLQNFTLLEAYFEDDEEFYEYEEDEEFFEETEDDLEEVENELLLVDDFEGDAVDNHHPKPENNVIIDDFESEDFDSHHPKSKDDIINEPLETDVLEDKESESLEKDSNIEMDNDDNVDDNNMPVKKEESINNDKSKEEGVATTEMENESFEDPELTEKGFQAE